MGFSKFILGHLAKAKSKPHFDFMNLNLPCLPFDVRQVVFTEFIRASASPTVAENKDK